MSVRGPRAAVTAIAIRTTTPAPVSPVARYCRSEKVSSKPSRTSVIRASTQTASTSRCWPVRTWFVGGVHAATPELESSAARSSSRPRTTGRKPLTVVIVLRSPRSTRTSTRSASDGNSDPAVRSSAGSQLRPGDHDDEAARPAGRRGASGRLAEVVRPLGDPAGRVEQDVDRPGRGVHVPAHQRHLEVVAHGAHRHRRRGRHGHLELRAVGVRRDVVVEQDGGLAAPGLDVLPDQEGVRLGRRAPVDVPEVVAGDVLAQGVERQVAGRRVVARDPVEVADQSRVEGPEEREPRPHQQLLGRGPAGPPPQQAERVGADVHDRPHDVHAARQRRDLDRLGALGPGRDERQPQRAGLPRDVEPHRGADQRHPPGPDRDLGRGRLTRGHPVGVDPEPAARGLREQHQDEGRRQQERADGRDDAELEPPQPAVHRPRQQRQQHDRPADRGDGARAGAEHPEEAATQPARGPRQGQAPGPEPARSSHRSGPIQGAGNGGHAAAARRRRP